MSLKNLPEKSNLNLFACSFPNLCFYKKARSFLWAFHPIFVTSFLVVFVHYVTKILRNSLFIFHFVLTILSCKRKTSYKVTKLCDGSGNNPEIPQLRSLMYFCKLLAFCVSLLHLIWCPYQNQKCILNLQWRSFNAYLLDTL